MSVGDVTPARHVQLWHGAGCPASIFMRHSILSLLTLLLALPATAGDVPAPLLGAFVGGAVNIHRTSFGALPGIPSCCPEYSGGYGIGPAIGLFAELPLASGWSAQARLDWLGHGGLLEYDEHTVVADIGDTVRAVDATIHHELRATLFSVGIQPSLVWHATKALHASVGLRMAYMYAYGYRQTETLTEPDDFGGFSDGGRVRNASRGNIPQASTLAASAVLGVRTMFGPPPGGGWFIAPEIAFHVPLTGVTSAVPWSVAQLQFGVSIGRASVHALEPPGAAAPPPAAAATPPGGQSVQPQPSVEVTPYGILADGSRKDSVLLVVEEIEHREYLPMLPHVYFGAGESALPARYLHADSLWRADSTSVSVAQAARATMAVVAARLLHSPTATITLVGTVSGKTEEQGTDKGAALAQARAEAVRTLLVSYGVDSRRIVTRAQGLPDEPTRAVDSNETSLADEENQRVEIQCQDPAVLQPMALTHVVRVPNPPHMAFDVMARHTAGVKNWRLHVGQGNSTLLERTGSGVPPATLEWPAFADHLPMGTEPMHVRMTLTDRSNDTITSAIRRIPVSQKTIVSKRIERRGDSLVERFHLILFAYNDVQLSARHNRMLDSVRTRIGVHGIGRAVVYIRGYTDVIGSAERNAVLSRRRAEETYRHLNIPQAVREGRGEAEPVFGNEFPEGRAYNRTVIVEVVTQLP